MPYSDNFPTIGNIFGTFLHNCRITRNAL